MGDFVHLHNHSDYSFQDAAATVDNLVKAAVANGMHSLALTDHGGMFGAAKFYKTAKKAGIKPIIGIETYIVMDGSRFEKNIEKNSGRRVKPYNHLILIAKNKVGYQNLIKLSSIGFLEGFYYRPRIDMDVLAKYNEGLICSSACASGPVAVHLVNDDYEKAKLNAKRLKELFGEDFYLEIQDHNLDDERKILASMPRISKELGIKIVATNDIHYIKKDDAIAHNILINLGNKTGEVDYKQLRYRTDEIYFKSIQQMKDLFKHYPGAIENTLEIDEKVDLKLEFEHYHYPQFPIPKDSPATNLDEYFRLLAEEGLRKRFSEITPEIQQRFDYEVEIIKKMGFSGYLLIVQDFINAAKKRGIPVGPGRGSAAGSLAAYACGITNVNPLSFDLLFERFLNPERKSMPDIDVDFADDQRIEVVDYVREKYGHNSVCQIVTFNTLSSRAVLKDVGRVLGMPIQQVENITKHIPTKFGKVYTISEALEQIPELKWIETSTEEKIQELIKYSKVLEGMNRNISKHAAGVVIAPEEVSNFVPLAKAGADGSIVTQYNMKEIEDFGLLKMDFLGLRTLSIIRDAIQLIKKNYGIEIDIDNIPLDDEKTYELFGKGQTTAVFQFESGPMREYLKKLKPTNLEDLAAMNALYRPGPMDNINSFIARKHEKQKITYLHPMLEPILKTTYGIIVYQEQVIQIANKIGGMSLGQADILRRAMGKKDLVSMKQQKERFIEGAQKNGISKKIAEEIFIDIDKFANYGFNKSHAVAYSLVAFQTAYLKANYLAEFLAANMTNEFINTSKITTFLEDCRKLNVEVMPIDINIPSVKFDVIDRKILFGMSAIKNVGINAIEEIIKAKKRKPNGFTSIYDLCVEVDTRVVNKKILEGLVLAGAFDKLKGSRAQIFYSIEKAIEFGQSAKSAKDSFGDGLFGESSEIHALKEPELEKVPNWAKEIELEKEREVLGFYLSDHPLRKYEREYYAFSTIHLGETDEIMEKLELEKNEMEVKTCVVVTELSTKIDKSGKKMAFMQLDDFSGSCEAIMFGRDFEKYVNTLRRGLPYLIKGKVKSNGDGVKVFANEVIPMEIVRTDVIKTVVFKINEFNHQTDTIEKLSEILSRFQGKIKTRLLLELNNNNHEYILDYFVEISNPFLEEIEKLLGENSYYFALN